jgi:mannan endo-1,4-beta-mannosidase
MSTTQQLSDLFASLRPDSLVRFWAFESQATNRATGQRDWRALDRVFEAAANAHQRLIVTLADDWGRCDGAPKDTEWYRTGYRGAYWNWLHEIVNRYRSSPALGMWEPVNEPEVACGSSDVLRSFFDAVGGELHRLDSSHLVESGTIGGGQCGLVGAEYAYVHASPGIDIATYHDYDAAPLPGDQWNGLATRLAQAAQLGKPLIIGEVGMNAADGVAGCPSTASRRDVFKAKLDAQLPAGVAGFLPWVWSNTGDGACNHYLVQAHDPSLILIHDYPL